MRLQNKKENSYFRRLAGILSICLLSVLAGAGLLLPASGQQGATPSDLPVAEVQVAARKYKFTPNVITVKKGQLVRLIITAEDRDHGIRLKDFDVKQRLVKGAPTIVEFTPREAGTFVFKCSVRCGLGHGKMKGKLVVEE